MKLLPPPPPSPFHLLLYSLDNTNPWKICSQNNMLVNSRTLSLHGQFWGCCLKKTGKGSVTFKVLRSGSSVSIASLLKDCNSTCSYLHFWKKRYNLTLEPDLTHYSKSMHICCCNFSLKQHVKIQVENGENTTHCFYLAQLMWSVRL